jgi:hypothetical protein
MKRILNRFLSVIAGISLLISCAPDEFFLGSVDVKPSDLVPGIAFKIEPDAQNPNIIHLRSLMDKKYTPLWDHPQGRSQSADVTLKIPFPGTYSVKFGVQTRGGVVYGEPATFSVQSFYAPFVQDEMWEMLSGGVDQEKTWYLDLDENGLSRQFLGPLYFYGTDNGWLGDCMKEGGDCWNWNPDFKGNSWLMNTADFGSMTFDLKGGAHVKVEHKTISSRGTETGTYMLDTENKTMRITDASPLHDSGRDKVVIDWGNIKILSLTKDHMQLAVLRDPVLSGEGACLLVYNYISKEFKENWTPGVEVEPEPPYMGNANEDLTTSTTTTKKWILSSETPYNWTNLAGEFLNPWSTAQDYQNTGWAPYNINTIKNISLTLSKTGAKEGNYIFTDGSGKPIAGVYSVDDKNNLHFDKAISFTIADWVSLSTTSEKTLRVIRSEVDASGNMVGIWLGARDAVKDEYLAYHFLPSGASSADPLAAWRAALVGKTFVPDTNWFVDWVEFPPTFKGGWTSSSTFGNDFTSNGWVWDEKVKSVAESASLTFRTDGDEIKVDVKQKKDGLDYTASGTVKIDPDKNILTISVPLVDYAGTAANWLPTTNTKSISGSKNDWYFVSHGGSNLSNIDSEGIWLGVISSSIASGDTKDEVLIFHFIKK